MTADKQGRTRPLARVNGTLLGRREQRLDGALAAFKHVADPRRSIGNLSWELWVRRQLLGLELPGVADREVHDRRVTGREAEPRGGGRIELDHRRVMKLEPNRYEPRCARRAHEQDSIVQDPAHELG